MLISFYDRFFSGSGLLLLGANFWVGGGFRVCRGHGEVEFLV
jgi:hypothetical protein